MVNIRIKIAILQSVLSALLKVDDNGSPLHCYILLLLLYGLQQKLSVGRLLRVSPLCYGHLIGGRTKGGRAKPIPLYFLERTVTMMTKTEILKFRVTPEEKEIITHKALSSYRLVSQYLRDCALEIQITVIDGADNVAEELRRIGNNVNQITRAVNTGFITEVNLTETREELKAIWQSLNSLLRTAR